MLDSLYLRLADLSPAALIIIPLAIMFFCAFGMTASPNGCVCPASLPTSPPAFSSGPAA